MLSLTVIVGLALILHLRRGRSVLKPWLVLWIVTLVCLALVYFAPGNAVRESTFPLRHDLSRALAGSLDMGWWTLISWLSNPLIIIASLLTPFAVFSLYQLSDRSLACITGARFSAGIST